MKTKAEIEQLKEDWRKDAIWDIENTQGFEAHRDELVSYRLACEAEWEAKRKAEDYIGLAKYAIVEIGPDSASAYAAIAQAQQLKRIGDLLEQLVGIQSRK